MLSPGGGTAILALCMSQAGYGRYFTLVHKSVQKACSRPALRPPRSSRLPGSWGERIYEISKSGPGQGPHTQCRMTRHTDNAALEGQRQLLLRAWALPPAPGGAEDLKRDSRGRPEPEDPQVRLTGFSFHPSPIPPASPLCPV